MNKAKLENIQAANWNKTWIIIFLIKKLKEKNWNTTLRLKSKTLQYDYLGPTSY